MSVFVSGMMTSGVDFLMDGEEKSSSAHRVPESLLFFLEPADNAHILVVDHRRICLNGEKQKDRVIEVTVDGIIENVDQLNEKICNPMVDAVMAGRDATLLILAGQSNSDVVTAATTILFQKIGNYIDLSGGVKPAFAVECASRSDLQCAEELATRLDMIGKPIPDPIRPALSKNGPDALGNDYPNQHTVWASAVEVNWDRQMANDLLVENRALRTAIRFDVDRKGRMYMNALRLVLCSGGPEDISILLHRSLTEVVLLFTVYVTHSTFDAVSGLYTPRITSRLNFLFFSSSSRLLQLLDNSSDDSEINTGNFRFVAFFRRLRSIGRMNVLVQAAHLNAEQIRRVTLALGQLDASEKTDGPDLEMNELSYYKRKAEDLYERLQQTSQAYLYSRQEGKKLLEQKIRKQVVDEMLERFNKMDRRQNEAHREAALQAEDLAEDRIRIWIEGTRQRYENMIAEQAIVYETRIRALEKKLSTSNMARNDDVNRNEDKGNEGNAAEELDRLRALLTEKNAVIEDYKALLEEAGDKFMQQEQEIADLKGKLQPPAGHMDHPVVDSASADLSSTADEEKAELRATIQKLENRLQGDGEGGLELIELECKVTELEKALYSEKERAKILHVDLEQSQKLVDELRGKLDTADDREASRRSDLEKDRDLARCAEETIKSRVGEMQQRFEQSEFELNELTLKYDELNKIHQKEIENAKNEQKVLQSCVEEMEQEINNRRVEMTKLTEENAQAGKAIEKAEENTKRLKKDLDERERYADNLAAQLMESNKRLQVLEQENKVSLDLLTDKQKAIEKLDIEMGDVSEKHKEQIGRLEAELNKLKAQISAHNSKIRDDEAHSKKLLSELQDAKNNMAQLTLEKQKLQQLNEQLTKKSNDKAENDQVRQKLKTTEKELVGLRSSLQQHEVELKKLTAEKESSGHPQLAELEQRLLATSGELERLRTGKNELAQEISVLKNANNGFQIQVQQLSNSLEMEKRLTGDLKTKNLQLNKQISQFKTNLDELSSSQESMDRAKSEAKAREDALSREMQLAKSRSEQLTVDLTASNNEIKRLKLELQNFSIQQIEKTKSIAESSSKSQENEKIKSLEQELRQLKADCTALNGKKGQLESQLEASRDRESRMNAIVAENSRLKLDYDAVVRDLKITHEQLEKMKRELAEAEAVLTPSSTTNKNKPMETPKPATVKSTARSSKSTKSIDESGSSPPKRSRKAIAPSMTAIASSPIEEKASEQSIEISNLNDSKKTTTTRKTPAPKKTSKKEIDTVKSTPTRRVTSKGPAKRSPAETSKKRPATLAVSTPVDETLYSPTGRAQRISKTIATDAMFAMQLQMSNSSHLPGTSKPKSQPQESRSPIKATSSSKVIKAPSPQPRSATPPPTKRNLAGKRHKGKLICSPIEDSPDNRRGSVVVRGVTEALNKATKRNN